MWWLQLSNFKSGLSQNVYNDPIWMHKIPDHIWNAPEGERKIIQPIYERRMHDMNFFLTTIGKPGQGKSSALLKLFTKLQVDPKSLEPNFDVKTQVVFSSKDFLDRVRHTNPKEDPGKCILFDEIEIEANSKGWDKTAYKIGLAVNTMRFKLNVLGASLPRGIDLIKPVRAMRDARLICDFINWKEHKIHARYHILNYNLTADTFKNKSGADAKGYNVRYKTRTSSGKLITNKIKYVKIGRVDKKIDRDYKKMKADYLNDFYDKEIQRMDKEENKQGLGFSSVAEWLDKNYDSVSLNGKMNPVLLQDYLHLSLTQSKEYIRAYNIKKEIRDMKRSKYMS
jgi:hypothetical protein